MSTRTHSSLYAEDPAFYLHDKMWERYNQTYILSRQTSYGSTLDGEDEQGISQVESHSGLPNQELGATVLIFSKSRSLPDLASALCK